MNTGARLTKRESEIAELIAWGLCKKEVADQLCISGRTVENHARSIFAKIEIQKATELCVWWFCTHCGVSFDLSPVKRQVVAILMLFILIPNVAANNDDIVRTFRTRTTSTRTVRRSGRRNEYDLLYN